MADLTEIQASQSVKLSGANPATGQEDNYLEVDTNGYIGVRLYDASGSAVDTNYGAVSAHTIRTASQIGNATGAADFNAGATGAQTLRVVANQGAANATPWNENVAQFGGSAVVTGTGASGSGIPRITVSNDSNILSTQSGTWTTGRTWTLASGTDSVSVVQSTSPWVTKDQSDGPVTPGAVASFSQLMGGQFNTALPTLTNTQQSAIQIDASGRIIVAPTTQGALAEDHNYGTVGATTLRTASQIGNATGSADFNYGTAGAQTLRTASQIGNATGAALFGAGTTTAQVLRVVLPTDQTSIPVTMLDASPANGTITAFDAVTTSLVGANGQVFYIGTPTANSAAVFNLNSIENVTIQANLLGGGGTLVVEVSMDGGTFWLRPNAFQISTQSYSNGYTAPFIATVNVMGMTQVRVRAITSWAGTATIIVKESINSRGITIEDALPAGANVIGGVTQSGTWTVTAAEDKNYGTVGANTLRTASQIGNATGSADFNAGATGAQTLRASVNQGTPGTAANAWFDKITDGTNVAAVKAASTAPVATDPALVVGLSPNGNQATAANQSTEITSLQLIDDVPSAANAAFVKGSPSMGQLDDTSTVVATEDNVSVIRITPQRAQHVNLRNQAGTELGTTAAPVKTQSSDGTDLQLVTTNGEAKVVDGLRNGGVYGALSIPTANTAVEAKVGASRLTNRKFLQIVIQSTNVWYGLDSSVTTTNGTPTSNGQVIQFSIDPDSTFQIWLVGNANGKNAQIIECP